MNRGFSVFSRTRRHQHRLRISPGDRNNPSYIRHQWDGFHNPVRNYDQGAGASF